MLLPIETTRLILREILPGDVAGMFQLDSDPEVHRYLGNRPIKTLEEAHAAIDFIRQQYIDNGIGRWAVIEKDSQKFIGWAGLKLIRDEVNGYHNYYDLGYRFIRTHWGKGLATEAAQASIGYAKNVLKLETLYAITDVNHTASRHVLEKLGFQFKTVFDYDHEPHNWLELSLKD